jgi:hypothetical protein
MSAAPAAKRARAPALEATVTTLAVPGTGCVNGLCVLADGTRLVSSWFDRLLMISPSGLMAILAGDIDDNGDGGFEDGTGTAARFHTPDRMTVDPAGRVAVVDEENHALRLVSKAGAVSTLAGNGEAGFADGQGAAARFNEPLDVVLAANGEFVVADSKNHALRAVTPGGAVRTLAGNGEAGFADGQGAAARFNCPAGLALDADGSLLVTDCRNHAVRRVTMAGAVSTVAGNGEAGFADGVGAAARFHFPADVVVDRAGTIVVADRKNHRLRKIVGGQVTTLAGASEAGAADGAGAGARFNEPIRLALDERGRLLVAEHGREDALRVVSAALEPPAWMGPVDPEAEAAAQAQKEKVEQMEQVLENYGKLVGASELADVGLVVEGELFPAHRAVLVVRSEYFRGLLLSGMQEGCGQQEIALGEVSAEAFRVVLRFLYTGELPAWEELQSAGTGAEENGAAAGGQGGRGSGRGKGRGTGTGKEAAGSEDETGTLRASLELEVLKAADLFQAEGLRKHCLEGFRRGLTVHTAVEQLVWAQARGPAEARAIATEFFVANSRAIRVRVCGCGAVRCGRKGRAMFALGQRTAGVLLCWRIITCWRIIMLAYLCVA